MVSVGTDFMSGIPRGLITEPVLSQFVIVAVVGEALTVVRTARGGGGGAN